MTLPCHICTHWFLHCTDAERLADAFDGLAREVARWSWMAQRSIFNGSGDGGSFVPPIPVGGGHQRYAPTSPAPAVEQLHPSTHMDLLSTEPPPRTCAIPLLVELCAGTAALSLRLERAKARPPVSRMGAKTGYADIILALAGLNPGDKAEHYLWCEPDDGVRLLLHAYRDADLAREAAAIIRSWADEEPRALWERLRAEGPARCPPVDAREVGRQSWLWARSVAFKGPRAGYMPGDAEDGSGRWVNAPEGIARKWGALLSLPATIHDDAGTVEPPVPLPEGTIAYMDPPYLNTTGYAHDFGRAEVVKVVRRWADAGARVMISEAEPIPELVADGWHAVEITHMRVGQRRTFSKQQQEWVTMNTAPNPRAVRACEWATDKARRTERAMAGGEQASLFGGDQ